MRRYVVRRLGGTLLLILVVCALSLLLVSLAPGDTAVTLAGGSGDPTYLAELRQRLGLDRALPIQIGSYLASLATGDLGFSFIQGRSVASVIAARVPATLLLVGSAMLLSTLLGLFLGIFAASRKGTRFDTAISLVSIVSFSLPAYWVGQLLVAFVAVRLNWLPVGGMHTQGASPGLSGLLDTARHMVLPVFTLSLPLLGVVLRTARVSAIGVLSEPYTTVARALGISERRLLSRHVLREVLKPVVIVVSYQLGFVLTGAVLVEVMFSWPGLGTLLLSSVLNRDNATLVGLLLLVSTVVAIGNLVADLVIAFLDPRVRLG